MHDDCFTFLNPWQNIKVFSDFTTCPLQEPAPCQQPGLYLQTYFSLWHMAALPCSSHLGHLLSPPQVKVTGIPPVLSPKGPFELRAYLSPHCLLAGYSVSSRWT